jgi:hypothetical protein
MFVSPLLVRSTFCEPTLASAFGAWISGLTDEHPEGRKHRRYSGQLWSHVILIWQMMVT